MARTEAINTFTDGLVMDLNEVNTPNSVLTDALNATIITYDGNEHLLQNDKGNYGLKNCKLPKYYVPVGMKEYGDILYIASYNPLDKKFQLGSFPSIKQVACDNGNHNSESFNTWEDLRVDDNNTITYKEAVKDLSKIHIFIDETDKDRLKIYPGDKIKLQNVENILKDIVDQNTEPNDTLITYTEWGIVTEESNEFKKLDEFDYSKYTEDFALSPFEEAGWLAVRVCIPDIEDVKISNIVLKNNTIDQTNVTTVSNNAAVTTNSKISFDTVMSSSDKHFDNIKSLIKTDIEIGDSNEVIESLSENTKSYDSPNGTSHVKVQISEKDAPTGKTTIKVTPKFTFRGTTITYDPYEFTIEAKDISSIDKIKLAENLWRYTISEDSADIEFDATAESGFILPDNVDLKYRIRRLSSITSSDSDFTDNNSKEGTIGSMSLGNGNYIHISKDDVKDYGVFNEDYFVIKIYADGFNNLTTYRLITTSKLMNDINSDIKRMDKVSFNEWSASFNKHISGNISITNNGEIQSMSVPEIRLSGSILQANVFENKNINNTISLHNFSTSNLNNESGRVESSVVISCPVKFDGKIDALDTGIWNGALSNSKLYVSENSYVQRNSSTGEYSSENANLDLRVSYSKDVSARKISNLVKIFPYTKTTMSIGGGDGSIVDIINYTTVSNTAKSDGTFYALLDPKQNGYKHIIEILSNPTWEQLSGQSSISSHIKKYVKEYDASIVRIFLCMRKIMNNGDHYNASMNFGQDVVRTVSGDWTVFSGKEIVVLASNPKYNNDKMAFFQVIEQESMTTYQDDQIREYISEAYNTVLNGIDKVNCMESISGYFHCFNISNVPDKNISTDGFKPYISLSLQMENVKNLNSYSDACKDLVLNNVHSGVSEKNIKLYDCFDINVDVSNIESVVSSALDNKVNNIKSESQTLAIVQDIENDITFTQGSPNKTIFIAKDSNNNKTEKEVADLLNNGNNANSFAMRDLIFKGFTVHNGKEYSHKEISIGKISDDYIWNS